jgi:hypothetical protein
MAETQRNPESQRRPSGLMLWSLIAFLFFFWQAFSYFGFVGRLAEWQFDRFETYFPVLTVAILVGIAAIIGVVLLAIRRRRSSDQVQNPEAEVQRVLTSAARTTRALSALAVLGAVAALVTLVLMWMLPGTAGTTQRLPVMTGEAVVEGPASVDLDADLTRTARFEEDLLIRKRTIFFAPVMTGDTEAAVSIFVEVRQIAGEPVRYEPTRTGVARIGTLPSEIASLYQRSGLSVAKDHVVLYRSPESISWRYQILALEFFLFSLICLVFALFQNRSWKRLRKDLGVDPE